MSSPPSVKRTRNIGVFGPFAPGVRWRSLPGAHQVDAEDEILVLDRKEEVLSAPPRAFEAAAVESGKRRIEGLQRRDVRGAGLLDRRT